MGWGLVTIILSLSFRGEKLTVLRPCGCFDPFVVIIRQALMTTAARKREAQDCLLGLSSICM